MDTGHSRYHYHWIRREGSRWQTLGREAPEGEWTLLEQWTDDDFRAQGVDPDRVVQGISWDPEVARPVELRQVGQSCDV